MTEQETDRLIGLARIPTSRTRISTVPKVLSGPVAGRPESKSLVDTDRLWRVPMSFDQAESWLPNHPPAGLPESATSGGSDNGVDTTAGAAYSDHDSTAWHEAELEIGIAPDGPHQTYWRADGIALWLDPHPLSVPSGGRRLAVGVGSGCPATDRDEFSVQPSGLTTALVPSTPATAGLICRYTGLNGDAFALHSQRLLSAAQASRIAALARHVDLSHTNGDAINCPADDGSAIAVSLSFAGRPDVALFDSPGGCGSVSNGTIRAASFASGLAALTRALS